MIPGTIAVAAYAVGELPAELDRSTPNAVRALLADPDSDLVFVLVAWPSLLTGRATGFPYAVASRAIGELDRDDMASLDTVYLSDRGWVTDPDEEPASRPMPARLDQPLNFETRVPLPGESQGRATATVGQVRISNPDGALDHLLDYGWGGRPIEIRLGGVIRPGRPDAHRLAFREFATVFRGTVESLSADESFIALTVRDPATRLEVPVQARTYAGTGGLEGGADLAGRYLPVGYGLCRQVPAPMVDRGELLFQLHDGAIQAVLAARDKGVPLDFAADYPTVTTLLAASQGALGAGAEIEAGSYATCRAQGYVRLGGQPKGLVTFDFQGDAPGGPAGYVDTAPAIVRRLATTRARPIYDDPREIDAPAFAALAASPTVGIWAGPDGRTAAGMCTELMRSLGGWWVHLRDGKLSVGVLAAPASKVAEHRTFIAGTLEERAPPEPAWRQRLGYRKHYAVQDEDALADSLTAEQKAGLGRSYRFVQATSDTVRTIFGRARDAEHESLIDDEPAAQAEVDRRLKRDRRKRRLVRFAIAAPLFRYGLGETHRIGFDALGLARRDGVVVARAEDAAGRRVVLELWG